MNSLHGSRRDVTGLLFSLGLPKTERTLRCHIISSLLSIYFDTNVVSFNVFHETLLVVGFAHWASWLDVVSKHRCHLRRLCRMLPAQETHGPFHRCPGPPVSVEGCVLAGQLQYRMLHVDLGLQPPL